MESMSAPPNNTIRIGNAERDAAIKALDEHMTAGRLDAEEYGERVAQASVARTREAIDALFVDLPAPHPFPQPAPSQQWNAPRSMAERTYRRFAGESMIVRIAVIVLAATVIIAAMPFLIAAAILFFVVLPMLGLGGWRHGPWPARMGRMRARGRCW